MGQKPPPERNESGEESLKFKKLIKALLDVDKNELAEQERLWLAKRKSEKDSNA